MTMTKTIIGLTGNIATGKSVVRRMLANAGALGLDADIIAHRLYDKDSLAYSKLIDIFGQGILAEDGQISRKKLGQIVFSDPEKLLTLEAILHPLVIKIIQKRIERARTPIIVIEAIKLFEAGLNQMCDQVWVSHVSREVQLARLIETRNLTEQEALLRIDSQTPQLEKQKRADVVVHTQGSFFETWQQVIKALNDTIEIQDHQFALNLNTPLGLVGQPAGCIPDQRLAAFWLKQTRRDLADLYELLGSHLITTVQKNQVIKGMAIWQEWRFTAILKQVITARGRHNFIEAILKAFKDHGEVQQCEILLISQALQKAYDLNLTNLGYDELSVDDLFFAPWRTVGQVFAKGQSGSVWVRHLANPIEDLAHKKYD